jgi:hypothetical protein
VGEAMGRACFVRGPARGGRRHRARAGFISAVAVAGGLAVAALPASAGTLALAGGSPVTTTTTLTASPNPANAGTTVTLTADTSAADGTYPAGMVQFAANGTDIGSALAVNASGVATTTTSFASSGQVALTAAFTPTSSSYLYSQGTGTETVYPAGTAAAGSEPVTTTVPVTGAFTLTVAPGTVNLNLSGSTATGTLEDVTVTDTRNTYPGWSVSGQASNFTGTGTAAGATIAGNQLGWVPTAVGSLMDGATLGGTVAPVSPGLGTTAATLASAAANCGFGTNVMSANLTLDIPALQTAGPYASTMTITAVVTGPANEFCVPIGLSI